MNPNLFLGNILFNKELEKTFLSIEETYINIDELLAYIIAVLRPCLDEYCL